MRLLPGMLAGVLCANLVVWSNHAVQVAVSKANRASLAERAEREHLLAAARSLRAASRSMNVRFGALSSPEARAELLSLQTRFTEVQGLLDAFVNGTGPATGAEAKAAHDAFVEQAIASQRLLELYAFQEAAESSAAGVRCDRARRVAAICRSLIANQRRMGQLQAERAVLEQRLHDARKPRAQRTRGASRRTAVSATPLEDSQRDVCAHGLAG